MVYTKYIPTNTFKGQCDWPALNYAPETVENREQNQRTRVSHDPDPRGPAPNNVQPDVVVAPRVQKRMEN